MLYVILTFCYFLSSIIPPSQTAVRLNEYIRHYEPLSYNADHIHSHHLRAKRSTHDPFVHIKFHAHGRNFNLRLKGDDEIFAENFIADAPSGTIDLDTSHIYHGSLWGEPDTHVFGALHDGVFDGKIHTPNGSYYVERAHKYFPKGWPEAFHSVIYHDRDISDPYQANRTGHIGGCGVSDETLKWMNSIAYSAEDSSILNKQNDSEPAQIKPSILDITDPSPHHKYSREAQRSRSRRAVPSNLRKRACSLYIQTDPLLFEHVYRQLHDLSKTREEITSIIAQHVRAVNHIYENTNFNGRRGITFVVQRITINDTNACNSDERKRTNLFCSQNIDVSNFLNLNSQMNHDDFCLSYVFTYRDFSGGTLGLAWVASPQGASGGICEKYKAYTENIQGRHLQTKRSLNTGIITFVNYNSRVPPKVSQLTLAHEIGHNFGSPHDWPAECRPGGAEGNFIMFASATPGDRPNNSKFSECSVRNITAVLEAVMTNTAGKSNCFQEDNGPFCGNKIVEGDEECDCGYDKKECQEECCYPKTIPPEELEANPKAQPCRRKRGTQCSPSEGPCCNDNCQFERRKLCRLESDCNFRADCDGRSAKCPVSAAKANKTECNEKTQVCLAGECSGSICIKYDLEECFPTREIKDNTPEKLCEVSCQHKERPETCRSTFAIAGLANISGIKLRPGSPCDNFQGFCDVFQKCRAVDAEGPLARLKNLILNPNTLMTVAQWVTEFWWAVLLMGIAFVIVMGIFIKCCAVHTPSSNPKKPPALRITDTLRRPAETLRRKRAQRRQQLMMNQNAGQPLRSSHGRAPPPYPGRASANPGRGAAPPPAPVPSAPTAGPPHGYGDGRGHYNKSRHTGRVPSDPYAPAYPGRSNIIELQPK